MLPCVTARKFLGFCHPSLGAGEVEGGFMGGKTKQGQAARWRLALAGAMTVARSPSDPGAGDAGVRRDEHEGLPRLRTGRRGPGGGRREVRHHPTHAYTETMDGFSSPLTSQQVNRLTKDTTVISIEPDTTWPIYDGNPTPIPPLYQPPWQCCTAPSVGSACSRVRPPRSTVWTSGSTWTWPSWTPASARPPRSERRRRRGLHHQRLEAAVGRPGRARHDRRRVDRRH